MSELDRYKRQISNGLWSVKRGLRRTRPSVLFITHQNRVSGSQIFPFYFFRSSLLRELNFDFQEITLSDYQLNTQRSGRPAEIVFVQTWWDIAPDSLKSLLQRIRYENLGAKIVFLDSFAPLDLRLAQYLDDAIDVYVKKQIFRDRSNYGKPTKGDTNLVDYYGSLYQLDYPETSFNIPHQFMDKLLVGPGFATGNYLLPTLFNAPQPVSGPRAIDLHARLGGSGNGWYGKMRDHSREVVSSIKGLQTASQGMVSRIDYLRELMASKLCFSPFGFGEVCWRDYEAVMCGSLLIKPDMSHIETHPDIFRAFESYVPVRWDFADLEEKVHYYLKNESEREGIIRNAYQILHKYFREGGFLRHVRSVMENSGCRK